MIRINNKGFTLLETIATIVIISFVVVSVFTIIVNIRTQTFATNEEINAIEVASLVRDQLQNNLDYDDLNTLLDENLIITYDNYEDINNFPSEVFNHTLNNKNYNTLITITFYKMTSDNSRFGVINYKITINYFSSREIELEGIIYE